MLLQNKTRLTAAFVFFPSISLCARTQNSLPLASSSHSHFCPNTLSFSPSLIHRLSFGKAEKHFQQLRKNHTNNPTHLNAVYEDHPPTSQDAQTDTAHQRPYHSQLYPNTHKIVENSIQNSQNAYTVSSVYPYSSPVSVSREIQQELRKLDSVPQLWDVLATRCGDLIAVVDEHHTEEKTALTFNQTREKIAECAAAFSRLGVKKGDKVAVFSESSYRWLITDFALQTIGAVSAVRGIAAPVEELEYIYNHSDSVALVVESLELWEKLKPKLARANVRFVVALWDHVHLHGNHHHHHHHHQYTEQSQPAMSLDSIDETIPQIWSFPQLLKLGMMPTPTERICVASKDDVLTLLYTSGTTGHPKGVILTHGNILHQVSNISLAEKDVAPGDVFVSLLPCWHIFERTAAFYVSSRGGSIVYSNIKSFKQDLLKHRPQILVAVPRIFEVIYNGVITKLRAGSLLKQLIFKICYFFSESYIKAKRMARRQDLHWSPKMNILQSLVWGFAALFLKPFYLVATILVWKKIQAGVGGRFKLGISGGGSLNMNLENFFECAGLDIFVGYGLTETAPVLTNRIASHNVRGSVGLPVPGTEIKIVDIESKKTLPPNSSGLVVVKGPQVTLGYYKNETTTKAAFDDEGYFNTGDLGYITDQGDLVITGRFKDIIVLNNGENVEPQPLEDKVLESPAVDQVVIVGQDKRYLGCLCVPNLEYLEREGYISAQLRAEIEEIREKHKQQPCSEIEKLEHKLVEESRLKEFLHNEILNQVQSRKNYVAFEKIVDLRILLTPFTVENGMMTQTLKIKKNVVTEKYANVIESMYHIN